ncbi:hypothetical protein GcM1_227078 [Golovinomyces cichoracearum]|uniref:G1 s-specific cyclin pas1 n=1 Tax=Golovinomyces cichoracearum TaxID=62708 RepID=A0A420IPI1_9PEZI|nr:hypothetical protein GcM1_227078 [Golovinomyces cichoracearum]
MDSTSRHSMSNYDISFKNDYQNDTSMIKSVTSVAASIWSDVASQGSDNSSVTSDLSTNQLSPPFPIIKTTSSVEKIQPVQSYSSYQFLVPHDVQQCQRYRKESLDKHIRLDSKVTDHGIETSTYVDSLVDFSAQIIETIWHLSSAPSRIGNREVLPLRKFVQETLRRSRTSYSTLQVALYYLILIKPHIARQEYLPEKIRKVETSRALQCGRRVFLSALILASKYLQDRNYSARAWSKISGLGVSEINQNEVAFLIAVNWQLHITDTVYRRWIGIISKYTSMPTSNKMARKKPCGKISSDWKSIILGLSPQLDNLDKLEKNPLNDFISSPHQSYLSSVNLTPSLVSDQERTSSTSIFYTSKFLEPTPSPSYPISKLAPTFELLPTPKMTPQFSSLNNPALTDASYESKNQLSDQFGKIGPASAPLTFVDKQMPALSGYLPLLHNSHYHPINLSPVPSRSSTEFSCSDNLPTNLSSLTPLTPSCWSLLLRDNPNPCYSRQQNFSKEQPLISNAANPMGKKFPFRSSTDIEIESGRKVFKKPFLDHCLNRDRTEVCCSARNKEITRVLGLPRDLDLPTCQSMSAVSVFIDNQTHQQHSIPTSKLPQEIKKRPISNFYVPLFQSFDKISDLQDDPVSSRSRKRVCYALRR